MTLTSAPFASIVLPVYNQAGHIGAVLEQHASALARLDFPWELLPVVNGIRRDESLGICRSLEARIPGIRTLCIEHGSWGHAVRAGLAAARGELLCFTNSARTTSQDLMLALLYGVANPDAVIKATRKIRDSRWRRMGSLLYNLECRALFDLPYWDINGTPKVFPRRLSRLLELSRNDDLIDLEFNVICRREHYRVIEVPTLSATRHTGRSTAGLASAFRLYVGALKLRRALGAS